MPGQAVRSPERLAIDRLELDHRAVGHPLRESVSNCGQWRSNAIRPASIGGTATIARRASTGRLRHAHNAVRPVVDPPHRRGPPTRSPSSSASLPAHRLRPADDPLLLGAALDPQRLGKRARRPGVEQEVQQRDLAGRPHEQRFGDRADERPARGSVTDRSSQPASVSASSRAASGAVHGRSTGPSPRVPRARRTPRRPHPGPPLRGPGSSPGCRWTSPSNTVSASPAVAWAWSRSRAP